MALSVPSIRAYFTTKIGRCAVCMRQSMSAALGAWAAFAFALVIGVTGIIAVMLGMAAAALTALWLLHVALHAARVNPLAGRRRALGAMLGAAGAGIVLSVPGVLWSSAAYAFCGQCSKNDDCGEGWSCKNTAAVNSGEVCNECVED